MMTSIIVLVVAIIMIIILAILLISIGNSKKEIESLDHNIEKAITESRPKTSFDYRIAKGYLIDENIEDEITEDQYPVYFEKSLVLYILWHKNKYYIRVVDDNFKVFIGQKLIEHNVNMMLKDGDEICIEKGSIKKKRFVERIIEF